MILVKFVSQLAKYVRMPTLAKNALILTMSTVMELAFNRVKMAIMQDSSPLQTIPNVIPVKLDVLFVNQLRFA